MKIVTYLCCLIILAGCAGNGNDTALDSFKTKSASIAKRTKSNNRASITPYKLNDDYTVTDSGQYANALTGGSYLVVKQGGKVADTIDKCFGIKQLSAGIYFYRTLESTPPEGGGPTTDKTLSLVGSDYLLVAQSKKTVFNVIDADFDKYSSSPNVINNKIYYWRLNKIPSGEFKISAAEYDASAHSIQSTYLYNDMVATDDEGYFCPPYLENDTIYFAKDKNIKKFSKDLKAYN
jgi:hypothetical protein